MVDKKMEENIAQFCGVTGASEGRASLPRESHFVRPASGASATARLNALFHKYKDADGEEITVDGTIRMCEDLGVDPEDVVLLAVAFELKSPHMDEWSRAGYVDGWKALGADSIPAMQAALSRLRTRLTSGVDPKYFQKVYNNTFEFAKSEGQRSIPLETATALWDCCYRMQRWEEEWMITGTHLWRSTGGVPNTTTGDTWIMFLDFVRSIDARFATYDVDAAWPSSIDDFVELHVAVAEYRNTNLPQRLHCLPGRATISRDISGYRYQQHRYSLGPARTTEWPVSFVRSGMLVG
ncbi:Defective in cullin neddylation protein [Mycena indigotica]|uniref:Defective in cullin neddylation protein n=1 Tax=Mycena indigotica TaxID=2126181 RepID=A0A8H6RXX5_9AGAR|nr:Defective in cullin neddylation protein [Mycena indigotica]KAF7288630.1 Defective in cullin neddylation protein [Mycena indigotica]